MIKNILISLIFYISTILYNYTETDFYLIIQLLILNSYIFSFRFSFYILLSYEIITHHKLLLKFFKFIFNIFIFNVIYYLLFPLYYINNIFSDFIIKKRKEIINNILSFGLNMVLQGKGILNQFDKQNKKNKKKNKKNKKDLKDEIDDNKLNNIINLLADNLDELNKNIDINNNEEITDNLDDYFN